LRHVPPSISGCLSWKFELEVHTSTSKNSVTTDIKFEFEYLMKTNAIEIYKKRRNLVASNTKIGTSAAIAVVTHGVSLVGVLMGAQEREVEEKKLELLEEEWSRRQWYRLDNRVFEDIVVPAVLSGVAGAFTLGVDLGMANSAATAAMTHAAYVGCAHPVYGSECAVTGNTFPGIADSAAAGDAMTKAGHFLVDGAETYLRHHISNS